MKYMVCIGGIAACWLLVKYRRTSTRADAPRWVWPAGFGLLGGLQVLLGMLLINDSTDVACSPVIGRRDVVAAEPEAGVEVPVEAAESAA